jgi:hypothetical protein
MRIKKIKKNTYIYTAVLGVFVLAFVLFLSTSHLLSGSEVPLGYKKSSIFSNKLAPEKEPKILYANIDTSGFSQSTFTVPFPQDGSFYELQLTNTSDETLGVRLVRSPNGDWKDDPVTKIPAREKIPFVFHQIGEYIIENAQNPDQTIIVQVK